ncbi:hypothetical protein ACWKSP_30535 [Micromonosporaceae bacterium Da 78-11]
MTVITRSAPSIELRPVAEPSLTEDQQRLCVCGHEFHTHEHLRAGTDCAGCGPRSCRRFRTDTWLNRLFFQR